MARRLVNLFIIAAVLAGAGAAMPATGESVYRSARRDFGGSAGGALFAGSKLWLPLAYSRWSDPVVPPTIPPTQSPTSTPTQTPSATPTLTPSPTRTATLTPTEPAPNSPTHTRTPTRSATPTPSVIATAQTATGTPAQTASPSATPSDAIRVMTYNIQDGSGTGPTDPNGPWCCDGRGCCGAEGGDRLPRILEIIKLANPDILGIQEAYLWQLDKFAIARRVAAELGMNFYVGQSQSTNGAHVALFTRFTIKYAQGYPGHFEGLDYTPRAALRAELMTPDGQTIHVFVVHLKFQVSEMLYLVQQMAPYLNSSTLPLGDMNFLDPSEMADRLRGAGWRHPLAEGQRVDQIWTSPSLEPFVQPGPTIPLELTRGASDHRPVVVELRIP